MYITEKQIREIVKSKQVEQGLAIYQSLMDRVNQINVSKDLSFQDDFRKFYQMRRFYSDDFAKHYFVLLEQLKNSGDNISMEMILERVLHIQNTYEISFSSKMLHTINPLKPIWDSIVTKNHFDINAPSSNCKDRTRAIVKKYSLYEEKFYDFMATKEGMLIIKLFDETFPNNKISDVKKVDFVLWQDR